MKLREIRARARRRLDDNTAHDRLWQDAELDEWINEAEAEACIRAKLIYDTETLAIQDGTSAYMLKARVIDVLSAYLTDADGIKRPLAVKGRQDAQDEFCWPDIPTQRPTAIVPEEDRVELFGTPDAAYTATLGIYREPKNPMVADDDEPEIHARHHAYLVDWVEYRAYSIMDTETFDIGRSERGEANFTRRFGVRRDANVMRKHRDKTVNKTRSAW